MDTHFLGRLAGNDSGLPTGQIVGVEIEPERAERPSRDGKIIGTSRDTQDDSTQPRPGLRLDPP
jgi:hypothetical protein